MITLRTSDGDKGVAAITLRTADGDKAVARVVLRTADGDKVAYSSASTDPLAVSVSPFSAIGSGGSSSAVIVTTNEMTVSASGGVEPYIFSWAKTTGEASWVITSALAASTRFSVSVESGTTETATFTCTVTDARGRTGSVVISAVAYNFGDILP